MATSPPIAESDHALFVSGSTSSPFPGQTFAGRRDGFVAKIDKADGSLVWGRLYGLADSDSFEGVAVAGSLVYAVGYVTNTVSQPVLVSYDMATGSMVSAITDFGTAAADGRAHAVAFAGLANRLFVTGYTFGDAAGAVPNQGQSDIFVAVFDGGALNSTHLLGSARADEGFDIVAAENAASAYVVGEVEDSGELPGQTTSIWRDAFVAKFVL